MKKTHALTALGLATVLAVPAVTLVASPAHADIDRSIRCAGAQVELSVSGHRRGFEVEGDVENARPGSKWRVVLRHEGKVVARAVRTADREGDLTVERNRPNTAGTDTFRLTVEELRSGTVCSTRLVTR